MLQNRIIPCLLISNRGLVKTQKFKGGVYVGDPVNAVRIFSEKEADELVILDIDASLNGRGPDYDLIAEIAGECFMPVAYGGGVTSLDQVRQVIRSGVEKVVIGSHAYQSMQVIREAASIFGSQAVVGCIDVRKTLLGQYRLYAKSGTEQMKCSIEDHVSDLIDAGIGELMVNNISEDGMMGGYDLALIKKITDLVDIPVVACGGAGDRQHLQDVLQVAGASAAAAGSMFVFRGKHKAVLINYPKEKFEHVE